MTRGLEQMHEDQSGDDVQHHQDCDERHLQGEPLQKRGLEEDERGSAADRDEGRRGGHLHIDETSHPVQVDQAPVPPRCPDAAKTETAERSIHPTRWRSWPRWMNLSKVVMRLARRAASSTRPTRALPRDRAATPAPTLGGQPTAGRRADSFPKPRCWQNAPRRAAAARRRSRQPEVPSVRPSPRARQVPRPGCAIEKKIARQSNHALRRREACISQ